MASQTSSANTLVEGNAQFALNLYKEIAATSKNSENLFFSPGSISIAVAMTLLGARNNTAQEMKKVLGFSHLSDDELHASFAKLSTKLGDTGNAYVLHIANRLFSEKSYSFLEGFMADTMKHYKAESAALDFKHDAEKSRLFVNDWVEKQTNKKIVDLLAAGTVDPMTRLILVNAIYFKGDWKRKFKVESTKRGVFTRGDGRKVEVPMMFQKEHFMFGYDRNLKIKLLSMPYVGGKMNMLLILPDKNVNINDVTSQLRTEHLLQAQMTNQEVEVTIPKFKIDCSFTLNDTLTRMGMKEMFVEGKADFSGMDGSRDLYVGSVVHKAFIEVNEEGSEAAAATAVRIMTRCARRTLDFKADRPFLYFIQESSTNTLLFMGCMNDPGGDLIKDEL